MKQFDTPILIIAFNRPNHIRQLIESLTPTRPINIYVFCDGPRPYIQADFQKCIEVRNIITQNIDSECNIKTKFSEKNYGCGKGPVQAINWFFEQVEEGIILEDDSIPNNDFFYYMQELLTYYRNDIDIMAITSTNFQPKRRSKGSYYFSMQNGCFCSWATWKKAWSTFDYYLANITENDLIKCLRYYKVTNTEIKYWLSIFKTVKKDRYNDTCWDYQFIFTIWLNKGQSIVPNFNLTTNIGFDFEATHTVNPNDPTANKPTQSILPIIHPTNTNISRAADLYYHKFYYQPDKFGYKLFKKTFFEKYREIRRKIIRFNRNLIQRAIFKILPELTKLRNPAYNLESIMSYSENVVQGKNVNLGSIYRLNNVQVGDGSYISQNSQISNTKIGKFCSIGPNFFCGWGIHPTNGISTAPMFYSTKKQNGITLSESDKIEERKEIIIGNDVFIGANVTVLDGVIIGDGAVIGAGAVVSKDIPPYAVAVGCPIEIIKYRFDEDKITELLKLKWWDLPEEQIQDVEKMFFDIDAFIKKYAQ